MDPERFVAEVEGINEMNEAGTPVLRRVHVRYRLPVDAADREAAERALTRHVDKCPTAQTLKGAVEITASAEWE